MEPLIVRPATRVDLADVEADVAALFAEDSGTRDVTVRQDWPGAHGRAWLEDQLNGKGTRLFVARSAHHVGYLAGAVQEANAMRTIRVATLVSMYVRPEARGSGAGSALVAAFREWARSAGAERLSVTAYTANDRALRFYERHGFGPHETRLKAVIG